MTIFSFGRRILAWRQLGLTRQRWALLCPTIKRKRFWFLSTSWFKLPSCGDRTVMRECTCTQLHTVCWILTNICLAKMSSRESAFAKELQCEWKCAFSGFLVKGNVHQEGALAGASSSSPVTCRMVKKVRLVWRDCSFVTSLSSPPGQSGDSRALCAYHWGGPCRWLQPVSTVPIREASHQRQRVSAPVAVRADHSVEHWRDCTPLLLRLFIASSSSRL